MGPNQIIFCFKLGHVWGGVCMHSVAHMETREQLVRVDSLPPLRGFHPGGKCLYLQSHLTSPRLPTDHLNFLLLSEKNLIIFTF